jgi:hypothetical protein
LLPG